MANCPGSVGWSQCTWHEWLHALGDIGATARINPNDAGTAGSGPASTQRDATRIKEVHEHDVQEWQTWGSGGFGAAIT
jgi:hypothetical protein